MELDWIPENIRRQVQGLPYTEDATGKSGSRVLLFPETVLKAGKQHALTEGMARVMQWLEGRLPVPRILAYEKAEGQEYLLMTRIPGQMACAPEYLNQPDLLLSLLAESLRILWQVDWQGCPQNRSLDQELAQARYSLEHHLVDISRMEQETLGPGGFKSPEALLRWLEDNKPPLEPAFSHGDCCLPNIFFDGARFSGFIDLGDAGIADKWRDLSLCFRSLRHNTNGFYGRAIPDFRPERLFDFLGISPDWDKMRYYLLLDEFF